MTRRRDAVWLVTRVGADGFMHHYVYASAEAAKSDQSPPVGREWSFDRDLARWEWSDGPFVVWIALHPVIP